MNQTVRRVGHALCWVGVMYLLFEVAVAANAFNDGAAVILAVGVMLLLTDAFLAVIEAVEGDGPDETAAEPAEEAV